MADPRRQQTPDFNPNVPLSPTPGGVPFIPVPAQRTNSLDDAVKALLALEPKLDAFFAKKDKEAEEQDTEAGRAAALKENLDYAEAVRQGKLPANQSKYFMQGYKKQYGEILGQQWASEAKVAWETSEAKNSDDPNAIRKFLTEYTNGKMKEGAWADPDVRAGILPSITRAHAALIGAQTEYASKKVKETHLENVGVAISQDLDLLASRKITREQFMAKLQERDAQAISMGIDKNDMTTAIVQAAIDKAQRTGDKSYIRLLDDYRFVGKNPKFAGPLRNAENAIDSKNIAQANLAHTMAIRRQQEIERVGLSKVYDTLFTQWREGKEIAITPEIEKIAKESGSPQIFTGVISMMKTLRDQQREMDPKEIDDVQNQIIEAGTGARAKLSYLAGIGSIKNVAVYEKLAAIADRASDLTNDRSFTDGTQRILTYGGVDKYGASVIDPYAKMQAVKEFRVRFMDGVMANPNWDPQQRDKFALALEERIARWLDTQKVGGTPNEASRNEMPNQLRNITSAPPEDLDALLKRIREEKAKQRPAQTNPPK